jgi:hypothetical protein
MQIDYPLMVAFVGMIFGSFVTLKSDLEGKAYKEIFYDGITFDIDHYMMDKDIELVNELREIVRQYLVGSDFMNKPNMEIFDKYFKLMFERKDVAHEN